MFLIFELTVTAFLLFLNVFKDAFEYYMFHFAYYIVHQETNRVSHVCGFTEYCLVLTNHQLMSKWGNKLGINSECNVLGILWPNFILCSG